MAVPSLANVEISSTFQIWLNRTNELVDIVRSKALTASVSNTDITIGNATLSSSGGVGGTFTANTIIAHDLLRSNSISSRTGSTISSTSVLSIDTGATRSGISLISTAGARATFSSGATGSIVTSWLTGFENTSTNSFVIQTSTAGTAQMKVTTAGEVIATKFTGAFEGTANNATRFTNNLTLQMTGDVSWSATFNGATSPVSAVGTIPANTITNAKFRQSAGLSVVGRSANTTGNVADITADIDGQVLRRSGTAIDFGSLNLANANTFVGVLPVSRGGFGEALTLSAGSVLFAANATAIGSDSNLFWDDTNNRLGIGTTMPGNTLHVAGTTYLGGALGVLGAITANNNITAFTTVTASDIRLKENIVTIDSALDIIENLRGVTFDWKNKDLGGRTYGLIAQEVEEVAPELVYDNGDFKGVAYANIVSILIEAIKDLSKEVKALKG